VAFVLFTRLYHIQSAVDEIIERMDEYFLTKEDWDTIVELGVDDKKDDQVLKKISAATKTALTRK
jgi:replication factor C subunit 1